MSRVDEGLLKQFTAGDTMHFNPKHQKPFSQKPTARLIIAANELPHFDDKTDGVWRRLLILLFPLTIALEARNPHLAEEICEDMSGIFNWAVEGARRLRLRGRFVEPAISRKVKEEFQRECNPARLFIEECCAIDPQGTVLKTPLFRVYRTYCDYRGYKSLNQGQFGKVVAQTGGITDGRPVQPDESRPWAWYGIRLIPDSWLVPSVP